jgi:inosose dehydratase
MIENILAVAELAWEKYQVRPVVHPHAGGYIEFADEIEKFLQDVPYKTVGLTLDTGHLYYSRMDPVTWLRDKYDRIDFIHFKDIDQKVYQRVIAEETNFFDACAQKVMCPIGKGAVDYQAIGQFLKAVDYQGWITLEQERDPRDSDTSFQDIRESLETVKRKIFSEVLS